MLDKAFPPRFLRNGLRIIIRKIRSVASLKIVNLNVLVVVLLGCMYFFSFRPSSLVNGPKEVFDQDSRFIIRSLERAEPYMWNPQHHILYHVLNENIFHLVRKIWGNDRVTVFYYLKVFTLITAVCFFALFSHLLKALGSSIRERSTVLLLTGVSVTAWFNFAAFETHALAMLFFIGYLVVLYRLLHTEHIKTIDYLFLAGTIILCGLARFEFWLLWPVTFFFLLISPGLKKNRRPLLTTLFVTLVLGVTIYLVLVHQYHKASLSDSTQLLLSRDDNAESLQQIISRCLQNLELSNVKRMLRAVTIYSIMMPPGRFGFKAPLNLVFSNPFSAITFGFVSIILLVSGYSLIKKLIHKDEFSMLLLIFSSLLFSLYTIWDPREPFLWTLEFLPMIMIGFAWAIKGSSNRLTAIVVIAIIAVLINNYLFFYRVYS